MGEDESLSNRDRLLSSLMAGALAGALAKTTIAPLDRTKIYFQTTPSAKFSTRMVLKYLHQTYKTDGVNALFRGNSATMARIIPYSGIQFTSHEQWKRFLSVDTRPEFYRFLAGSLAGVTAQTVTYPLDMTRARLAISPKHKYKSLIDTIVKVVKVEGVSVLYRGYVPTMLGVIPYAGFSFYTYESLKRGYKKKFGEESGHAIRLLFGALAGILGQSSSYPFDIVRRRMQVGRVPKGVGVLKCLHNIYTTEGLKGGLYKGLSMNWLKGPIAASLSFTVFDISVNFLRRTVF